MSTGDYRYTLRGLSASRNGPSQRQETFGSLVVDLDADGRVLGVENRWGSVTLDNLMAVLNRCAWAE